MSNKDFLLPHEGWSDPVVIGYPTKANKNTMTYPTKEQVRNADIEELVHWNRFLPSPSTTEQREIIMDITKRIDDLGGITPEVSKSVGWGNNDGERKLNHLKMFEDFVNEISKERLAATKRIKRMYPNLGDGDANELAIQIDQHFLPDWEKESDVKLKKYAEATSEQIGIKLG